jgi:hypothetical protein
MFIIMILLYVHVAIIVRGRDRMGSFTYVNSANTEMNIILNNVLNFQHFKHFSYILAG